MADGLVILGGGLSGLAASVFTGAPGYEGEGRPGGVASSDTTDGFVFDRGIHILQTRNERVLALLGELGVELLNHSRNAYIYSRDTEADARQAKVLTDDEARRMTLNMARLPELLGNREGDR